MRRLSCSRSSAGSPGGSSAARRGRAAERTIGYADGSSVTLDPGSPELDRLLQIAAEATAT